MPDEKKDQRSNPEETLGAVFQFFNEIGIINQLASALFQKRLPQGVTLPQFSVLNHLVRVKDGQTPLALADAFQIPKTSMTHTLATLEKQGFVALRTNPQDGRSKCVWLTQAGQTMRENAIMALGEDVARLAPELDLMKMRDATPVLEHVRKTLDADRSK